MTKQSPPFLFKSPPEYPDKAGLSGWVPLIESGIQIHTLTPKRFISIDVYSCGAFETHAVLRLAAGTFDPRDIEHQLIDRGTKYHGEEVWHQDGFDLRSRALLRAGANAE